MVVVVAVRESPVESTQSLSLSPRVVVSREGEREKLAKPPNDYISSERGRGERGSRFR